MSKIEKLKQKFYSNPVHSDITVDEVLKLAKHYGCIVRTGGNHQCAICNRETGYVVPLPQHSSTVRQAYIKELRELFGDEEAQRKYGE